MGQSVVITQQRGNHQIKGLPINLFLSMRCQSPKIDCMISKVHLYHRCSWDSSIDSFLLKKELQITIGMFSVDINSILTKEIEWSLQTSIRESIDQNLARARKKLMTIKMIT